MPITKSARKAERKSLKNRERNLVRKNALDKVLKNFRKLVKEKKMAEAKSAYPQVQQALDKATKQGIIKANSSSRKKSRYYARIKTA